MTILCKILIGPHLEVDSFREFSKKITIRRDPRDRLISCALYSPFHCEYATDENKVEAIRRLLQQNEEHPKSAPFLHIVDAMGQANNGDDDHARNFLCDAMIQEEWFEKYLSQISDAYILKYEDFVAGDLKGVEEYLGFELSHQGEVPQDLQRVVRTKGEGDWKNWFTCSDIERLSKLLEPILRKYNHDLYWEAKANQVINPEHCSGYFMRLIEERRRFLAEHDLPSNDESVKPKVDTANHVYKVGIVDRGEENKINGWAIGSDHSTPVELSISVNNGVEYRVVADKFRKDLYEKGMHSTGNCGFQLILNSGAKFQKGDVILVKCISENFLISKSPYVV